MTLKSKIFNVGCPRIDSVDKVLKSYNPKQCFINISSHGSGDLKKILHDDEYIVLLYHPVTTEYEDNHRNFEQVLDAFNNIIELSTCLKKYSAEVSFSVIIASVCPVPYFFI